MGSVTWLVGLGAPSWSRAGVIWSVRSCGRLLACLLLWEAVRQFGRQGVRRRPPRGLFLGGLWLVPHRDVKSTAAARSVYLVGSPTEEGRISTHANEQRAAESAHPPFMQPGQSMQPRAAVFRRLTPLRNGGRLCRRGHGWPSVRPGCLALIQNSPLCRASGRYIPCPQSAACPLGFGLLSPPHFSPRMRCLPLFGRRVARLPPPYAL
jgi:hypothetical protein